MPTESAFVFAGLLFIAAALGYIFARYVEPPDEEGGTGAPGSELLHKLRHLLQDESNPPAESIPVVPDLSDDTLETHLALGALFRRQGDIERAIAIHRKLIERTDLSGPQHHRCELALADDYLGAGLYDRAEELLRPLTEVGDLRADALNRLLRVAEQTQEWERAVEISRQLEQIAPDPAVRRRQAHYYCELARQASRRKDPSDAQHWLDEANAAGPTIRTAWLAAELAMQAGETAEAARLYRRVISREPDYIVDVLPPLAAACAAAGLQQDLSTLLDELCQQAPANQAAIATAAILDPGLADAVALECLREYLLQDPLLGELVDPERLRDDEDGEQLTRIRTALNRLGRSSLRYRCGQCGYRSATLQWQCPGCQAWESIRPLSRIPLDPGGR